MLDWVPAHFPTDAHGLAASTARRSTSTPTRARAFTSDWNTLIYNFGRTEVRNFLVGNALYWLERFGIDGLRVDAVASMLYRDYSRKAGEWVPNVHGGRENLEAIDFLQAHQRADARRAPGGRHDRRGIDRLPGVSRPTYAGGLGFHYKWNMGWMHDTLQYMRRDPVHRRHHHDELTFGLVYAFTRTSCCRCRTTRWCTARARCSARCRATAGSSSPTCAPTTASCGPPGQEAAVHGRRVRAGSANGTTTQPRLAPARRPAHQPACSAWCAT